jgi:hypothetical protein
MLATVTMAASVSPDDMISQMGMPAYILATLIGTAVVSLVVGLLLKFIGGSVLGHPVKYGSAFVAVFVPLLMVSAIEFAMVQGDLIPAPVFDPQAPLIDQVMRNGTAGFAILQLISLILSVWAVRMFLKGPSDERPSWGSAVMISLILTVILIVIAVLMLKLNVGMQS